MASHILTLGSDLVYVYPDMETVLIGHFKNGIMKAARKSKIIAERCHNGIKEIRVAKPREGSPILKYSPPNTIRIGDQPTIIDPFERRNTYIQSGKWGDGVFAKRNFTEGDLVMYYSGLLWNKTEGPYISKNQTQEEM